MTIFGLSVPKVFSCLLALLVFCLVSGPVWANTINIYDTDPTGIITATVNGNPVTVNVNGPEEVWFTFTSTISGPAAYVVDMTEPGATAGTTVLSDRIGISYGANNTVTVKFCSEPSTFTYCMVNPLGTVGSTIAENGNLQLVFGGPGPIPTDSFYVQSAEVPEPTSLMLLGSGLSLVGVLARKFRK